MAETQIRCEYENTPEGVVCTLVSPEMLHQDVASRIAAAALAQHLGQVVQAELIYFCVASSGTRCALKRVLPAAAPAPRKGVPMWPDKR